MKGVQHFLSSHFETDIVLCCGRKVSCPTRSKSYRQGCKGTDRFSGDESQVVLPLVMALVPWTEPARCWDRLEKAGDRGILPQDPAVQEVQAGLELQAYPGREQKWSQR